MIKTLQQTVIIDVKILRENPEVDKVIENELKNSVATELKQKIKIERYYSGVNDTITFYATIDIFEKEEVRK